MSNISMVEAKLPPGFRFHPRDDELVCDYLLTKIALGSSNDSLLLLEVDLNKSEPWQIPDAACIGGKEWYFYSLRDRKYATGSRTNRATATGYWKATGKDRSIFRKGSLVGMRKTLVFYQGRAPKGRKTDWVMHEFRVEGPQGPPKMPSSKEDWVLCRVFFKNRDHVAKPSTGIPSYEIDDKGNALSLPPLMDSFVTFDHTNNNNNSDSIIIDHQYDEQVPCFSIFSQQQHPPNNPFVFPPHVEMIDNVASTGSCNYADAYTATSDNKVLKAVLNQLTNTKDQNPNNNVKNQNQTTSSDSFLSQVAGMWSHY